MVWENIKGALSSASDAIGSAFETDAEKKKKKSETKRNAVLDNAGKTTFDPFQHARDQEAAIKNKDANAMRDIGMSDQEISAYEGKDGTESNWQSEMGEAVKFLAANRKEKPKPGTPSLGSRNVNFDAGNFYGALQARQQFPMQFGFKG